MSKRQLEGEVPDADKPEADGAPAAKRLHTEAGPAAAPVVTDSAATSAAADAAAAPAPAPAPASADPAPVVPAVPAAAAASADASQAPGANPTPNPGPDAPKSPRSAIAQALAAKTGAAAVAAAAPPSQEQLMREYAALQAQQQAFAQMFGAAAHAPAVAPPVATVAAGQRSLTARVLTESRACGALIGKNGAVIQKFREQTGAQMDVAEQVTGAAKRIVTVKGEVDRVATAISMIAIRLAERESDSGAAAPAPTSIAVTILVSKQQAGVIIGRGGMVINATRDASRAVIKIAEMTLGDSDEKEVTIRGTPDQLAMAVVILCNQLADIPDAPYRRYTPGPESADPYAAFYGTAAGLSAGSALARAGGGAFGQDRRTVHINVPEFLCGALLGKGGTRINEIRQRSAADVKLGKPNAVQSDRLLTIIGTRPAVELAVSYVYETIEGVDPNTGKPTGMGSAGASAGSGINAAQHAATLAQLIVAQQQLYASNASVIGTPSPAMPTAASQAYPSPAGAAAGAYGAGAGAAGAYGAAGAFGGAGAGAGYGAAAQWQQYQALLEQQQQQAAAAASAYGAAGFPPGYPPK